MKKTITTVLITLAVVFLAFALNPSAEKHRTHIKETIAERSQLNKLFGVGHLTAFVSEYTSLGVASYTRVNEKMTSLGAFGFVYVLEE